MTTASAHQPSERAVLVTAALGTMLMPLNSTMVAVALPSIAEDLDASLAATAWLVSAYLIAQASLQPLSGKLGDRFGRRPLILSGHVIFGVVSLGAVFAPSIGLLILARVLQAFAGALVFPNAMGLIRELLPLERRGRALGTLGAAIGVAAALGPPLGGVLLELGGWRTLFLVNIPWLAFALWLALRTVPRMAVPKPCAPFDTLGAVALCVLLACTAWLLNPGSVPVWTPVVGAALLVCMAVWFARYELGREDPVLQPRFLRVRPFAAATASVGLSNMAMYGTLLAVPALLAQRGDWSEAQIGLALATMSLPMAALSPVGGRLSDRAGRRAAAVAGLALLTIALLPLTFAGSDVSAAMLLGSLALIGSGVGLSAAAVQAAGLEALDSRDAGIAAGVFATGRYMGGIAAASLVAVCAGSRYGLLFGIETAAAFFALLCARALPGRHTSVYARETETV